MVGTYVVGWILSRSVESGWSNVMYMTSACTSSVPSSGSRLWWRTGVLLIFRGKTTLWIVTVLVTNAIWDLMRVYDGGKNTFHFVCFWLGSKLVKTNFLARSPLIFSPTGHLGWWWLSGVDRAQVGVFEQANQVRFGRFLQRQDRGGWIKSVLKSWAISLTNLWNGNFRMSNSVDFWYLRISLNATVPGRYLCGFLTPPVAGADLRAALVASCFLGALPPVDLRAVCLVRAIVFDL